MTNEANKVLDFLASMPTGHTTTTKAIVREVLLATGGQMMACGELFNIKPKRIGAGVYELRLERWKERAR